MRTLLDPDDLARLREALTTADYREPELIARYGAAAVAAARRGDHRALLAATAEPDRLSTLVRLFTIRVPVTETAAATALAPLPLSDALAAGLLATAPDGYRPGLALDIHDGHWLLSDPPALGGLAADHVLGPGTAADSMAGYLLRRPVGTALDVGTGGGVLAAHLSGHAAVVTGTDVSERALRFAASNAVLNGLDWELLTGDMLEPVAGRCFDQVVSNPPFIVGPGRGDYDYRDSGRPGDAVCAELAAAAPGILNPGGTLQFLANWCHVAGEPWPDRIAGWFADSDCAVWAIQREVLDPLDYVRFWQRDAAEQDPDRLAAWLDWFDGNEIDAIGFGVVNARHRPGTASTVVCEDLRHTPAAGFAAVIADWFDTHDRLDSLTPDQLYRARLRLADGVRLHQEASHGAEGWEVERQLLAATEGMPRAEEIDPLLVSFLGGCDGSVEMRTQVRLLAQAHEADEPLLAASLSTVVRRLLRDGYLRLAD